MLKSEEDGKLFLAFAGKIESQEVRDAYRYLIGWGVESARYMCQAKQQGYIDSIRFYREDSWEHAFIPNQRWLTFYFRKPCLESPKFSRNEILHHFPTAEESNAGEFIVRVSNLEDAIRVVSYIEL